MAKEKQLKKNKGPKDILYRLVMAVLAACVPIAAYFCEYVYMVFESDAFKFLAMLAGNTTDNGETEDAWSVHRFVTDLLPQLKESTTGATEIWKSLAPIQNALICVAVFLVLAIMLALVVFFFSVFSKKKVVPMCIALGGVLAMIGVYISFNAAATPLLDGTIALTDLFSSSTILSLLAGLNRLSILRLSTGYFIMLFLFIAMALWAGANKLIELGDKPPKPVKNQTK